MPTGVPLDLEQFRSAGIDICAIVELVVQPTWPSFDGRTPVRPLLQVTIRQDKISTRGLIRLGETPGDEARCWIRAEHVQVIEILGQAQPADAANERAPWKVSPLAPETGSGSKAA